MLRSFALFSFLSVAFGQHAAELFEKAPPDVDQALRARIAKFYQSHVDGKFRQAEPLVAEDTKEFFYTANKPKYLSFEIAKIVYSDNFTRAKATVVCEQIVPVLGFVNKPLKVPTPSYWKQANGEWYWYVDQETLKATPFGKMTAAETPQGAVPATPSLANAPTVDALWKLVKADKGAVQLRTQEASSEQVSITNQMPGNISLALDYPRSSGLQAKLDRAELKTGEKAVLSFHADANPQRPAGAVVCRVIVQPTNQIIPIQVNFSDAK